MEEKELKEFSWTAFFLVTGFCFFAFSKTLYYLDGAHLPVFTWIGGIAFLIGSLIGSLKSIRTLMEKSDR